MTAPRTIPTPEQIRNGWDRIADRFDRFTTPATMRLAEQALSRIGLRPGMRFLDVAAGSGSLSVPAARLGAQVVATDFAPTMIERLRARAQAEDLANFEARVMDGNALDLEDDSFDVSASQHGVSLFPDPGRGLAEMVRVTRPGGRVLIVAFGPLPKAEFLTYFVGAIRAVVPDFRGLPTDPPPLPFQLAEPAKLHQVLADAGLSDVQVEPTTWRMEFESAAHFWDVVTASNPIAAMLVADLTPEQAAEVQRVLDGMLRERSDGGPAAVLNTAVNIGIGVV